MQPLRLRALTALTPRTPRAIAPDDWRANDLLAALPPDDMARWARHWQVHALASGDVVHALGEPVLQVVFPVRAIVLLIVPSAGGSAEVGMVGHEGLVGVAGLSAGGVSAHRATVLCGGWGLAVEAGWLRAEIEAQAAVRRLMLRYTQALMTQMPQTAVCNRHHAVYQQVCRCLLISLDRLPGGALPLTQEQLSAHLGVRREGVTLAAIRLQAAGVIRYTRGLIEVLDRPALERACCECYRVVQAEFTRLLAPPARPL